MYLAKKFAAIAAVGLLVLAPLSAGAVVINEIRIDQPSTDNDEYFELYGDPGESLDGLTYLVIGDGATGSGTIECVVDLSPYSILLDGFLSVGEDLSTTYVWDVVLPSNTLNFENSDNVTHMLVSGFTGLLGDDLDTDDDCVLDVTPWTSVVDTIALVETVGSGDCYYGPNTIGPDGTFVPGHVLRCLDGATWFIGLFDIAIGYDTPGDPNAPICPVGTEETSWGALKSRF